MEYAPPTAFLAENTVPSSEYDMLPSPRKRYFTYPYLLLGVVVAADDVAVAFEFVGSMSVVIVGLACTFVGTVGVVDRRWS